MRPGGSAGTNQPSRERTTAEELALGSLTGSASPGQERRYRLLQADPEDPAHNVSACLRLEGDLDLDALSPAAARTAARHPMLRVAFRSGRHRLLQRVSPRTPVALTRWDLEQVPADDRQERALEIVVEEARRAFDPLEAPLWRLNLVRLRARDHLLLLTASRLVCDLPSAHLALRELVSLLAARRAPAAPAAQYPELAQLQRRRLEEPDSRQRLSRIASRLGALVDGCAGRGGGAGGGVEAACLELELPHGLPAAILPEVLLGVLGSMARDSSCSGPLFVSWLVPGRGLGEAEAIGPYATELPLLLDLREAAGLREAIRRAAGALQAAREDDLPLDAVLPLLGMEAESSLPVPWQLQLATPAALPPAPAAGSSNARWVEVPEPAPGHDLAVELRSDPQPRLLLRCRPAPGRDPEELAVRFRGLLERAGYDLAGVR